MCSGKVSVIIPAYNVEKYIDFCLSSIVNQTYKDIQVLVMDDGSTDHTKTICEKYLEVDNRIKLICKNNGGPSRARNVALDAVEGKYIVFVDSDDILFFDAIEYMVKTIEKSVADILVCNYQEIREHKLRLADYYDTLHCEKEISKEEAWLHLFDDRHMQFGTIWASIFRKEIFDKIRFENGRTYEDTIIAPLLYDLSNRIVCSSKPVYGYYLNESSITHTIDKKNILDSIYASEKRLKWFKQKNKRIYKIGIKLHLRHLLNCLKQTNEKGVIRYIRKQLTRWLIRGSINMIDSNIIKEGIKESLKNE